MNYPIHYPDFFTATILQWQKLLQPDKYKTVITNSFKYLVEEKRVQVFGFVIMYNHIHVIWRATNDQNRVKVQHAFMTFTAQTILKDLKLHHTKVLPHFKVNAKDRTYQIWERNPLSVELRSNDVLFQKLQYIHENPVRAGICNVPEDYRYSSASLYVNDTSEWDFLDKWG
jgi:putative transposase